MKKQDYHGLEFGGQEKLFLSLGDQLGQIFLQIARLAELSRMPGRGDSLKNWSAIQYMAESALVLTDSYVLNERLRQRLISPEIEPVTVSSLMYDALQQLVPLAKRYDVELVLDDYPRLSPVMSDGMILQAALSSLGQMFVLAEAQKEDPRPVRFAAHKSRYGVVTGLYTADNGLSVTAFRRSKTLHGNSRQPMTSFTNGSAANVFVAESLLQSIAAKLHVARYHKLTGLATTLPACNQLQLI